jgi:hypothetical protein
MPTPDATHGKFIKHAESWGYWLLVLLWLGVVGYYGFGAFVSQFMAGINHHGVLRMFVQVENDCLTTLPSFVHPFLLRQTETYLPLGEAMWRDARQAMMPCLAALLLTLIWFICASRSRAYRQLGHDLMASPRLGYLCYGCVASLVYASYAASMASVSYTAAAAVFYHLLFGYALLSRLPGGEPYANYYYGKQALFSYDDSGIAIWEPFLTYGAIVPLFLLLCHWLRWRRGRANQPAQATQS